MGVKTSTGTVVSMVQGVPATFNKDGYEALTWVTIGEVTDFPGYGAESSVVEHKPIATGVVEKEKGFINYGSVSVGLAYDSTDAGQALLAAASHGAGRFEEQSFRVAYSDNEVDYFTGKVFSYTKEPGSADSMVGSTALIEINSVVFTVPPS